MKERDRKKWVQGEVLLFKNMKCVVTAMVWEVSPRADLYGSFDNFNKVTGNC